MKHYHECNCPACVNARKRGGIGWLLALAIIAGLVLVVFLAGCAAPKVKTTTTRTVPGVARGAGGITETVTTEAPYETPFQRGIGEAIPQLMQEKFAQ